MLSRIFRAAPCAALVLFAVIFCRGCTIHFKAKDVELESQANISYELEKADFLVCENR